MLDVGSGDAALAAAAGLGPFFRVDAAAEPGAVTWADLTGGTALLDRRVAEVRAVLAAGPNAPDVPLPVAASLAHLGLVARLLSPPLGAWLLTGLLPVAPADRVHLRPSGSNPVPLHLDRSACVAVPEAEDLPAALDVSWLRPAVDPLTDAVRSSVVISPRVLVGNVVSAVAGALRMASAARATVGGRAEAALRATLAVGPLAGTGRRLPDGAFVRNSCCLFYRLPGAGTCPDCILGDR